MIQFSFVPFVLFGLINLTFPLNFRQDNVKLSYFQPRLVQHQQDETIYNWMCNLVKQEDKEEKVALLSRRCMIRFLESLDPDSVDIWRCSVLLAATCLLVTSKIISQFPLGAKKLMKYSGGAFTLEELTVSIRMISL